jgi:hypothetical protein
MSRIPAKLKPKLKEMNANYEKIKGNPFKYFYCPTLHLDDEDIALCDGHVINEVFSKISSEVPEIKVVQRQDVDEFYGRFEQKFQTVRFYGYSFEQIVSDKFAMGKTKPFVINRGVRYPVYVPASVDTVPENHTPIMFDDKLIAVKIEPEQYFARLDEMWFPDWSLGKRLHAIPSLIKMAHLTLFHLFRYQYVMSSTGFYVANQILGRFFLQNRGKEFSEIENNAEVYFARFDKMVRHVNPENKGTLTDGVFVSCASNKVIWGLMVFVYLGETIPLQAVVLPAPSITFDGLGLYGEFLKGNIRHFDILVQKYENSNWFVDGQGWKPTTEAW